MQPLNTPGGIIFGPNLKNYLKTIRQIHSSLRRNQTAGIISKSFGTKFLLPVLKLFIFIIYNFF